MAPHGESPRHRRKPAAKAPHAEAQAEAVPTQEAVRLQKLLAAAGFGSRRSVEELILQGRVTINGEVAKLGDSAHPQNDVVALDGEKLVREKLAYWVVNKPAGVVTTLKDPEGRPTIKGLMPDSGKRLYPVGRLDQGTSGLVIMTNDGVLTQKLLHPSLENEREYRVIVRGQVEDKTVARLEKGVYLDEGRTAPAEVSRLHYDPDRKSTTFFLVLREGRKRQIRRSLLRLGHPVLKLVRTRMGPLRLGKLAKGEARKLREDEIKALRDHALGLVKKPRRNPKGRSKKPGSAPRPKR
jgi:23S rRNA pseudouridine2605 synthase